MDECEAFRRQAASDYDIYKFLAKQARECVPESHALHYLQMAAEKLAKAVMCRGGVSYKKYSHVAFSKLEQYLKNPAAARRMGYDSHRAYLQMLRSVRPVVQRIEQLHPAVGTSESTEATARQPNVEYPWRARNTDGADVWRVPAEHRFGLVDELRRGKGAQVSDLIERLLERFDGLFGP